MEEAPSTAHLSAPNMRVKAEDILEGQQFISDAAAIARELDVTEGIGVAMLLVVLPTGEITELIVGDAAIRKWREKK